MGDTAVYTDWRRQKLDRIIDRIIGSDHWTGSSDRIIRPDHRMGSSDRKNQIRSSDRIIGWDHRIGSSDRKNNNNKR